MILSKIDLSGAGPIPFLSLMRTMITSELILLQRAPPQDLQRGERNHHCLKIPFQQRPMKRSGEKPPGGLASFVTHSGTANEWNASHHIRGRQH